MLITETMMLNIERREMKREREINRREEEEAAAGTSSIDLILSHHHHHNHHHPKSSSISIIKRVLCVCVKRIKKREDKNIYIYEMK